MDANLRLYTILDLKAKNAPRLSACENDEMAVRLFFDECAPGQNTMISRHPEDFVLYRVAIYDPYWESTPPVTGEDPYALEYGSNMAKLHEEKANG